MHIIWKYITDIRLKMQCVGIVVKHTLCALYWNQKKNSKWVWSTITRHKEDKLSKATSSLFPIKMIAILELT